MKLLRVPPKDSAFTAAVTVCAVFMLVISSIGQHSVAKNVSSLVGPIFARGYVDAPSGTAVIAGDPAGGHVLSEVRVTDGQRVKRGDIIAVLSEHSAATIAVRSTEASLVKAEQQREAMVSGFRATEIAMQEIVVRTETESHKLKDLQMQRSGLPPEQRHLEMNISQRNLEKEQAKLRVKKEALQNDLALNEVDIRIIIGKLDKARRALEQSLVRSPIDGVVVQIYSRQGERVIGGGFAKIVDFSQLRVLADVDELHMERVVLDGRVEVTLRGSLTIYKGRVSRVSPLVKRMLRVEPDGATSTDARVIQIEITLDDASRLPQVLGREARVNFL